MNPVLEKVKSDIESCTKCKGMTQAIYPLGKAIGLTYVEPIVPLRILFVAESPPPQNFFYDEATPNPFRNRLFFLINEAGLGQVSTISDFNKLGYFLADAINCRWDKTNKKTLPTKIWKNCCEHLQSHVFALKPEAIVLMGKNARVSFEFSNCSSQTEKENPIVIKIPFILTAPVKTEFLVEELRRLPR